MPKRNPIPDGTRFARLTVISSAPPIKYGEITYYRVWCLCDCGNTAIAAESWLRHGRMKSCGCLSKERLQEGRFKHGQCTIKTSATYRVWSAMVQRCTNAKNHAFKYYGGRGITICKTWLAFVNFLRDMGEKPPGLTLERVDNSAGYSKTNCKWATRKAQQRNRRGNRIIHFDGFTGCLTEVCERFGVDRKIVGYRLDAGWTTPDAILLPKHYRKPKAQSPRPPNPNSSASSSIATIPG